MPELPEVQTVVNGIKSKVINRKILQFKKYTNKLGEISSSIAWISS